MGAIVGGRRGEVMIGGRGGGRSTVVQKSTRNKLMPLLRIALEAARFERGPVRWALAPSDAHSLTLSLASRCSTLRLQPSSILAAL